MLTQVVARVIYEKVGFLHWVIFSGVDFIHSLPSGNKSSSQVSSTFGFPLFQLIFVLAIFFPSTLI